MLPHNKGMANDGSGRLRENQGFRRGNTVLKATSPGGVEAVRQAVHCTLHSRASAGTSSQTAAANGAAKPGMPHSNAAPRASAALLAAMHLQASCSAATSVLSSSSPSLPSWSSCCAASSCSKQIGSLIPDHWAHHARLLHLWSAVPKGRSRLQLL